MPGTSSDRGRSQYGAAGLVDYRVRLDCSKIFCTRQFEVPST